MVDKITFNKEVIDLCVQFLNRDLRKDFFFFFFFVVVVLFFFLLLLLLLLLLLSRVIGQVIAT